MSMFFLSNPTLVIQAGINYCIGEGGFGTQLSPNPTNGQPIDDGPYAPFPPVGPSYKLSTFLITAGGPASEAGYSDGSQLPAQGSLLSGGGSGGLTLNAFVGQSSVHTLDLVLYATGNVSAPLQSLFNTLKFTDQAGTPATLDTAGAASYANGTFVNLNYTTSGNTSQWEWTFFDPIQQVFTDSDNYSITVS